MFSAASPAAAATDTSGASSGWALMCALLALLMALLFGLLFELTFVLVLAVWVEGSVIHGGRVSKGSKVWSGR